MTIDIGYEFKDNALLVRALTHSSAVGCRGAHNETLEFLGDSILDMYVASRLIALMPDARENILAGRRAWLVRTDAMTEAALRAGLDRALIFGRSVSAPSPRMLADAFEALVAAAFLDGGFAAVKAITDRVGLVE